jgi:multidrug efflux pump subunit AcrA (membrane-fusion protein)
MSFLDLLSGALGAVLILFIIIPKMTAEQQNALEQIEQLDVQIEELNSLIEQARNSIPTELFEQIQSQLAELQQTIDDLDRQVQQMQQRIDNLENENRQLREELAETQRQLQQAQQQLAQQQAQNRNIADGKIFGTNAKLGIICMWPENIDVDLYVKNLATDEICYHGKKNTRFGNLMEDVISRESNDDDRYEVFYQSQIVPGRYLVYVNIYHNASLANATSATIDGYAVMFPGTANQQKLPFRQIRLTTPGQNVTIGTLEVTTTNINLIQQ